MNDRSFFALNFSEYLDKDTHAIYVDGKYFRNLDKFERNYLEFIDFITQILRVSSEYSGRYVINTWVEPNERIIKLHTQPFRKK